MKYRLIVETSDGLKYEASSVDVETDTIARQGLLFFIAPFLLTRKGVLIKNLSILRIEKEGKSFLDPEEKHAQITNIEFSSEKLGGI